MAVPEVVEEAKAVLICTQQHCLHDIKPESRLQCRFLGSVLAVSRDHVANSCF